MGGLQHPADGHQPAREPADRSHRADARGNGEEQAVKGLSGFKRPIYRGPAPPPGKPHHYHFTVYALDVAGLAPGLTKAQLVEAMQGHIVAQGELVALYERKPPAEVGLPPWPIQPLRDATC